MDVQNTNQINNPIQPNQNSQTPETIQAQSPSVLPQQTPIPQQVSATPSSQPTIQETITQNVQNEIPIIDSEGDFETTVRVMKKLTKFFDLKVEFKNPVPTNMRITSEEIIFTGNPEKQDNSFLESRSEYIIKKESIKEIKFNQIYNSAIKIIFDDNGEKTIYIQYLSKNPVAPYNIHATEQIYRNLCKFQKGQDLESGKIPFWIHIITGLIFFLAWVLGGVIELVVAMFINILIYKFLVPKIVK